MCRTSLRCTAGPSSTRTSENGACFGGWVALSAQWPRSLHPHPHQPLEGRDLAFRLEIGLKQRCFLSFIKKPCHCCGKTHGSRRVDLSWVQGSLLRKKTQWLSPYTHHCPCPLSRVANQMQSSLLTCALHTYIILTGPKQDLQVFPAPETALI